DLSFNGDIGLLAIWILEITGAAKDHRERRNCSRVSNIDAELGQICGSYTSVLIERRELALNFSLRKKRLEYRSGGQSRITRSSRQRHKYLRYLPNTIHDAQSLNDVIYLIIDWRVENAESAADGSLVIFERFISKRETRSEIVSVGMKWLATSVILVPESKIQGQVALNVIGIFNIQSVIWICAGDYRVTKPLLIELGQSQCKRLQ